MTLSIWLCSESCWIKKKESNKRGMFTGREKKLDQILSDDASLGVACFLA